MDASLSECHWVAVTGLHMNWSYLCGYWNTMLSCTPKRKQCIHPSFMTSNHSFNMCTFHQDAIDQHATGGQGLWGSGDAECSVKRLLLMKKPPFKPSLYLFGKYQQLGGINKIAVVKSEQWALNVARYSIFMRAGFQMTVITEIVFMTNKRWKWLAVGNLPGDSFWYLFGLCAHKIQCTHVKVLLIVAKYTQAQLSAIAQIYNVSSKSLAW